MHDSSKASSSDGSNYDSSVIDIVHQPYCFQHVITAPHTTPQGRSIDLEGAFACLVVLCLFAIDRY